MYLLFPLKVFEVRKKINKLKTRREDILELLEDIGDISEDIKKLIENFWKVKISTIYF